MNPRQGSKAAWGHWHPVPSPLPPSPSGLRRRDGVSPFLTQTWDLLSAIAFFVLIFKRGHCGFKELPRLAFVTGGEGGVVAEVGTQKNEIKRSTTKRS